MLNFFTLRLIRPRHTPVSGIHLSGFVDGFPFRVSASNANDMTIPGGFGSTLIGGLVSAMLYGTTTLQTYMYYMHCSQDPSIIQFLVATIW
ncbi:hypothetical protein EDD16DRAFT_1585793 [Pisolithus croceorrhizus]|nr:hypothetical protein EDD16DRAFT_1585793 [Pisolithus croceorrhizus]